MIVFASLFELLSDSLAQLLPRTVEIHTQLSMSRPASSCMILIILACLCRFPICPFISIYSYDSSVAVRLFCTYTTHRFKHVNKISPVGVGDPHTTILFTSLDFLLFTPFCPFSHVLSFSFFLCHILPFLQIIFD